MVNLLVMLFFALSAMVAFGTMIGTAIRYGAAWDALEREAELGDYTQVVRITVRTGVLPAPGATVYRPVFGLAERAVSAGLAPPLLPALRAAA